MKDPLQTAPQPHEVLQTTPNADAKAVDFAYLKASRKNPVLAKTARDDLRSLVGRCWWYEVLQYSSVAAELLRPTPTEPGVLAPDRRDATAKKWERALQKTFPNAEAVHSLALLYFWWAQYEESQLAAEFRDLEQTGGLANGAVDALWPRLDKLRDLWERAIGYWSVLVTDDEFWSRFDTVSEAERQQLQEKVVAELTNRLHSLYESYSRKSLPAWAARYLALGSELNTELSIAREVREANILSLRKQKCAAGRLVLGYLGYLDAIREKLKERVGHKQARELLSSEQFTRLRKLAEALSPYRGLGELIVQKKPQEALDAIRKLPEEVRLSEEISELRSRAHHQLGNHHAELDEPTSALSHWKSSLKYQHTKKDGERIRRDVVSGLVPAIARRKEQQPEEARQVAEDGLSLVHQQGQDRVPEAANLRLALAELLTRGAVRVVREVQDAVAAALGGATADGGRPTAAALRAAVDQAWRVYDERRADVAQAVADLDRANELGSSEAERTANDAREAVTRLESELHLGRGVCLVNQATELPQGGVGGRAEAERLTQAGIVDLDRAAELGHPRAAEQARTARSVLAQMQGGGLLPAPRGAPGIPLPTQPWMQTARRAKQAADATRWDEAIRLYRQALQEAGAVAPQEVRASLAACLANRAVGWVNAAVQHPELTGRDGLIVVLSTAENDLVEADQLDPGDVHIQAQLAQVRDLLRQVNPHAGGRNAHVGGRPYVAPRAAIKIPEWVKSCGAFVGMWVIDVIVAAVLAFVIGAIIQEKGESYWNAYGKGFVGYLGLSLQCWVFLFNFKANISWFLIHILAWLAKPVDQAT